MTVGELGQRMTSAEFVDWLAYEDLEREDKMEAINRGGVRPVVVVASMEG